MPAQLEPNFDGRVSAVALGSSMILDSFGAWEMMAPHAQPIFDIRVSDGNSRSFLHYNYQEVGDKPFGYIVENRYIRNALHVACSNHSNLTIIENTSVTAWNANEQVAEVSLNNGQKITCQLVVAADGKQSILRALAGITSQTKNFAQTGIVCTIAHTQPHNGLAQERFLPAGPFAVLPMVGNRSSLVWVEPTARAPHYLALPEAEFVQEITERVGGYLGDIRVEGARFSYPLSMMHANRYIGTRLALIGDAAHGIHPIAGQGINLGFRDVAALEELLRKQMEDGGDIGTTSLLEHYQRWRRFDNVSMLGVTDGLNALFCSSLIPVRAARGLGFQVVSKLPALKRMLMKHAMGLVGDVPESVKKVS